MVPAGALEDDSEGQQRMLSVEASFLEDRHSFLALVCATRAAMAVHGSCAQGWTGCLVSLLKQLHVARTAWDPEGVGEGPPETATQ